MTGTTHPTKRELEQAERNLQRLKANWDNDVGFLDYLDTFVQSLDSITEMMRKEYGHASGFRDWWKSRLDELKKTTN